MKIGFFELEGWEEKIIREQLPLDEVVLSKEKIDDLSIPEQKGFEVLSVFIGSRMNPNVLGAFPHLKCLATRSTGYDHIDLSACKARGVEVRYVPGYGNHTVAEFTFGLLLDLVRKIGEGIERVKETGSFSLLGLRGMELRGKTIGVIGTGRIGKEVAKLAKAFGMNVIAFDPHPDAQCAESDGFAYVALENLLASSDIISIHCPMTEETRHLINTNNVERIKKGAYLVNTARGGVVSTKALVEGLQKGILAGAALDVLEEEGETKDELNLLSKGHPQEAELKTILRNHLLMKMPNVLISPHNAFNTNEALERILRITVENIQGYRDGTPVNLVPMP